MTKSARSGFVWRGVGFRAQSAMSGVVTAVRGRRILLSLFVIGRGMLRRIRVCIYTAAFFSVIGGVLLAYSYLHHHMIAEDARAMIGNHISEIEHMLAGLVGQVDYEDVNERLDFWIQSKGKRAYACTYDRRDITWASPQASPQASPEQEKGWENWKEDHPKENDVRNGAERCLAYLDHVSKGRSGEYCHRLAENCINDTVSVSDEGRGVFAAVRREDYFPMNMQCLYPHVRFSKACEVRTAKEGWSSLLKAPYSFWSLITFVVGLISVGLARAMVRPLSRLQEGVREFWLHLVGKKGTYPSHLSMLADIREALKNWFASPGCTAGRQILDAVYEVAKSISHHQSHLISKDEEGRDKYKAEAFSHFVEHVGKEMGRITEICRGKDLDAGSSPPVRIEHAYEEAMSRVRQKLEEEDSGDQKSKGPKQFHVDPVGINWRQQVPNLYLEEIFYHLFVNSTQHVKEGQTDCRVRVDVVEKENVYAFSVFDNGKGLESGKVLPDFIRPYSDRSGIGLMSVTVWVQYYGGEFYEKEENPEGYSGLGVGFTVPKAKLR